MASPNEVRDRFLAGVEANDVAAILGCYHEDAVLIAPEGRYEGRDYIEAYYRIQFRAFAEKRLTLTATHDSAGVGVAEWSFSGINTGPLELPGGEAIPPTGRHVVQRGADFAVVENGLIVEHRLYYDQLELIDQLGLQATAQG